MICVTCKQSRVVLFAFVAVSCLVAPSSATTTTRRPSSVVRTGPVASATIVNLGALLGPSVRFVPTAINGKGQIVGYDDRTLSNGYAGSPYLINPDGTFGALNTNGPPTAFQIPLAISANGTSVAGEANDFEGSTGFRTGPVQWNVFPGARSHQVYRHFATQNDAYLAPVTGIADGNVPVAGANSYGATSFSVTPFKTAGCALKYFNASAANGGATIVGSAGGYAASDTLGGCPAFIPGVPRPANTSTAAIAENASGSLVGILRGASAPAYGAYYLLVSGKFVRVPLPPTFSSATYFVQTAALGDANAVVGNVAEQVPPFASVAPYLFANGRSVDVNTLLPARSGWRLTTASGIDGAGTIVGTGFLNGVLQGYALHP